MMEITESVINSLINLGLTKGEAKTYVALVIEQVSEASPLASLAEVSQPKIYNYLNELEKKNLVRKNPITGKPNQYEAIPFDQGTAMLKDRLNHDLEITKKFIEDKKKDTSDPIGAYFSISQGMRGIKTTLELIGDNDTNQPTMTLGTLEVVQLVKQFLPDSQILSDILNLEESSPPLIKLLKNSKLADFFATNNVGVLATSIDLKNRKCNGFHIIGIPGQDMHIEPLMVSITHPIIINFQINMLLAFTEVLPKLKLT